MITDVRMKELAEKFASELKLRLSWEELVELGNELDLHIEELEYFGWLDHEEEHKFTCDDCPYYYADCYDEDDMFEEGCCYCHYSGRADEAPCADPDNDIVDGVYEEVPDDYSENMPCDTYGISACSSSCPNYQKCQK